MKNQNKAQSWLLIIVDTLTLTLSYFLGIVLWNVAGRNLHLGSGSINEMDGILYTGCILLAALFFAELLVSNDKNYLKRGNVDEVLCVTKTSITILLMITLFLFVLKNGERVSRGVVGTTILLNVILGSIFRIQVKKRCIKRLDTKKVSQMLIVTTSDRAKDVLHQLKKEREWGRRLAGICILDDELQGTVLEGVKVVANYYDVLEYVKSSVVDEVFVHIPYTSGKDLRPFLEEMETMGVTVYVNINTIEGMEKRFCEISDIHGYSMLTYAMKYLTWNQLIVKRIIDILGALVGCAFTLLLIPLVGVPLFIESPGSLFFHQKRVGRNGRFFMIHKFRSMYKDAEKRKKELEAQNEMKGFMFKMTNDPRVTMFGEFIRSTSLDEFPQFFNILVGEMSLVGTRPPTVAEFEKYSPYHKRRLSLVPGLTGFWQVSGRSNIEDFEEVVKLDLQYIDEWSVGLDIKILLKTFKTVIGKVGSR